MTEPTPAFTKGFMTGAMYEEGRAKTGFVLSARDMALLFQGLRAASAHSIGGDTEEVDAGEALAIANAWDVLMVQNEDGFDVHEVCIDEIRDQRSEALGKALECARAQRHPMT